MRGLQQVPTQGIAILVERWSFVILGEHIDECIEWQVNYGYQKFHEILIKIQNKH